MSRSRSGGGQGIRLASKGITTFCTAGQGSTLLLKVGHADGWESRSGVVLGIVVVDLVDGDGSVDNGGLNSLLLNDWLNGFVDMVMSMLSADGGKGRMGLCRLPFNGAVVEMGTLLLQAVCNGSVLAVVMLMMLSGCMTMFVVFRQDLPILHRLDRGVVVILVDLMINSLLDLLVVLLGHSLMGDGWSHGFVDCGVMMS